MAREERQGGPDAGRLCVTCVYVYVYVCVHVYVCICVYAYLIICVYICSIHIYPLTQTLMRIILRMLSQIYVGNGKEGQVRLIYAQCIYVCVGICIRIRVYTYTYITPEPYTLLHVLCMYMYVYMYVCVYECNA